MDTLLLFLLLIIIVVLPIFVDAHFSHIVVVDVFFCFVVAVLNVIVCLLVLADLILSSCMEAGTLPKNRHR